MTGAACTSAVAEVSAIEAKPRRSLHHAILFGLCAATIRGGWALYANLPAGRDRALRAMLVQVAFSFVASFTMNMIQQTLFHLCESPRRGFWCSALGAIVLGVGLGTLVHVLSGTPRILATMAPSTVLATIAFPSYAWSLRVAAEAAARNGKR